MKKISLTQGQVAIIDDADFEKVGGVKWYAQRTPRGNFYAVREIDGKTFYLHWAILGIKGIDHIDGDGLNNRRENLRSATMKQNTRSFRKKSSGMSSKFRGVHWHKKTSKWRSKINRNGIGFHLGLFLDEKDAARAYDKKAIELGFFKEALNFPLTSV